MLLRRICGPRTMKRLSRLNETIIMWWVTLARCRKGTPDIKVRLSPTLQLTTLRCFGLIGMQEYQASSMTTPVHFHSNPSRRLRAAPRRTKMEGQRFCYSPSTLRFFASLQNDNPLSIQPVTSIFDGMTKTAVGRGQGQALPLQNPELTRNKSEAPNNKY
jgi:hypothetical protein